MKKSILFVLILVIMMSPSAFAQSAPQPAVSDQTLNRLIDLLQAESKANTELAQKLVNITELALQRPTAPTPSPVNLEAEMQKFRNQVLTDQTLRDLARQTAQPPVKESWVSRYLLPTVANSAASFGGAYFGARRGTNGSSLKQATDLFKSLPASNISLSSYSGGNSLNSNSSATGFGGSSNSNANSNANATADPNINTNTNVNLNMTTVSN